MQAKLSALQRSILANLLRYTAHVEQQGSEHACKLLTVTGVSLRWLRGRGNDRTRADSAAFSHALLRLEQRGLVIRSNVSTGFTS
jgi:hypothetical protein